MPTADALRSAADAFADAVASGADRESAFNVALAKFRAIHPVATEWEVRTLLAKALAAMRQQLH
jgi:hypothetical protein